MPNFHIPEMIREHLQKRAAQLADRPLQLALGSFPLGAKAIQSMVLRQDQVDTMQKLHDEGIKTIERHRELRLAILRGEHLPGLRRSAVVYLVLPEGIFVGRGTSYSIPTTKFEITENHYLIPTYENLDDNEKQSLTRWVEKCVRQVRLTEIVGHCVMKLLRDNGGELTPTTSHLQAIWPELAGLIDPEDPNIFNSERDKYRKWVERMRNPVRRNYAAYLPHPDVKIKFAKLLEAANVQLAAGLMLKDYVYKKGQIRAYVEHWEHLEADLRLER